MPVRFVRPLAFATAAAVALLVPIVWGRPPGSGLPAALEVGLLAAALAVPLAAAVVLLRRAARELEATRRHAREERDRLEAQQIILKEIAAAPDVTSTLQRLATRVREIVPCDRIGLALPKATGEGFQTFTGRADQEERRMRARVDVEFGPRGTLIADVVARAETRLEADLTPLAPDHLDANFFVTSGFRSAVLLPLGAGDRSFGVLYGLARPTGRFDASHVLVLRPIAELLGLLYTAQQLRSALTRLQTTEAMAELTFSIGTEISSALQIIIGHCDLLERQYPDAALQGDLATIVRQAQRMEELLENMRAAARRRLAEVSAVRGPGRSTS